MLSSCVLDSFSAVMNAENPVIIYTSCVDQTLALHYVGEDAMCVHNI